MKYTPTEAPTVESQVLEANIKARKAAREILDDCVPCLLVPGVCPDRFWAVLAEEAATNCGMKLVADELPDLSKVMTDSEAREFERTRIPWGANAGRTVGEVEPRYFLAITENDFNRQLTRYLRSSRFLDRQG